MFFIKEKRMITNWCDSYKEQVEGEHNEFLIQDLEEEINRFCRGCWSAYYSGLILKEDLQDVVGYCWGEWAKFVLYVREHEANQRK